MKAKILMFLSMVVFCFLASAKTTVAHKPALIFKIVYGEKVTVFEIDNSKAKPKIAFSNSLGNRASREISLDDYDFLKSKVSNLQGETNRKDFCTRSYIEVKAGSRELLGCLGSPNKMAKELLDIVNLISLLFNQMPAAK